jgi:hypothetical protein
MSNIHTISEVSDSTRVHKYSSYGKTTAEKDEKGFIAVGARGSYVQYFTSTKHPHNSLKWEASNVLIKDRCPFCENGKTRLSCEVRDFGPLGEAAIAFYECMMCDQRYTTTEIDDISMRPLLSKKRKMRMILETVRLILKTKPNGKRSNRQHS